MFGFVVAVSITLTGLTHHFYYYSGPKFEEADECVAAAHRISRPIERRAAKLKHAALKIKVVCRPSNWDI